MVRYLGFLLLIGVAEASNIHPTPVPTATPAVAQNTATPAPTATLVPTATPMVVPTATPPVHLTYSGNLTISDINAESSNFTVGHRIAYVTTGASTITATMPASPTVGDTYTIMKADNGAGTVVWTRAGSQTLNGATTRTVSAQFKSDTCIYSASNVWICQGDGT